ncbi:MAG: periplasmic heavy metal sensor [Melioribacteraceae bacterium]
MKKVIASIIITVFVFSSSNVFAQRKAEFKSFGKKMCAELNLTEAQQKNIEDLKADKQKKMIDLRAEIQKKKIDLKKIFSDGLKNEDEFLKLTDNISKLKSEIRSLNAKHLIAVSKILNEDQKKMWLEKTKFDNEHGNKLKRFEFHSKGERNGERILRGEGNATWKMKGDDKEIHIEKKIIKE